MLDLSDRKFGRLIAIKPVFIENLSKMKWECKCECGKITFVTSSSLLSGKTKSCGCLKNRQKGQSSTRIYRIWNSMHYRCRTKKQYKNINICPEWGDFETFKTWALANGYNDKLTIDRLDSKKDYEPQNCQWVSLEENSRRASQKLFTVNGMTKNITQWAKFIGLSPKWLWEFHAKYGDTAFVDKMHGFMG